MAELVAGDCGLSMSVGDRFIVSFGARQTDDIVTAGCQTGYNDVDTSGHGLAER